MEFLDTVFLDNTIRSYLVVLAIILGLLLVKRILSSYIASLLFLLIHKAWKNIEKKEFKTLIVRPLGWLIVIIVSVFALDELVFPYAWRASISYLFK